MATNLPASVLTFALSKTQRRAFRPVLEAAGFRTFEAATTEEVFNHSPLPDVILLNVQPDTEGFQFCRRLKSDWSTIQIPIIQISSSFAKPASIIEGLESGADACLVASISERELIARINVLIRLRDQHIRRTNRLLRESAEGSLTRLNRLRAALEIAQLGVWEIVVQRRIWQEDDAAARMELDDRCRRIFGVPPNHPLSLEELFALIDPDHRPEVIKHFRGALKRQGQGIFEAECRILPPDDSERWVIMRGHAVWPEVESPLVQLVGTVMDVTERKHVEQVLLRSEKLATAGRMAAAMAHEINNPLEVIGNSLFLASTMEDLPESARQHLALANTELKRVAHLTGQSLGFYRECNSPALTSVPAVLDSAVELLKSKAKAKQVVVETRCKGDMQLTGVEGELRQVFANLLSNSLDAVDHNGIIKLRVSTRSALNNGGDCILVTIADNGKGISAPMRSHLFEPFFTTKGALGTGLGLWVSKQIIEKHSGTLRVRSRTDGSRRGTTISILLPAKAATIHRKSA